jgi:hypothetical protein
VIIGEIDTIGHDEAFSQEKLCPILGMYKAPTFEKACEVRGRLNGAGQPGVCVCVGSITSESAMDPSDGPKLSANGRQSVINRRVAMPSAETARAMLPHCPKTPPGSKAPQPESSTA